MLTHGSLFSGIGGFDLGFERVGIQTIWQVEIDPYATKVLEKHWPNVTRYTDITRIDWGTVPRPDILSGGFPCQDISIAGKGAGITEGTRSGLWSEFHRAISVLRPKYVVVENVSALLFRGLGQVLGDLSEIGYDAEWEVIPASAIGAPHQRLRTFLIAYPKSLNGNVIQVIQRCQMPQSEFWSQQPGRRTYQEAPEQGDFSGWVIHESQASRVDDGLSRMVGERKACGNAVVPQIAEEIGRMILHAEAQPRTG